MRAEVKDMSAESYEELIKMSKEQLIKLHDAHAESKAPTADHYLAELRHRELRDILKASGERLEALYWKLE